MAQFRKDTHQYLKDGTTIFEVMMLADQYGNLVGPANPSGMAVDAFGRARVSQPYTLFDSFHRFFDNGKINTANNNGTFAWSANTSSINMTVNTSNNAYVYRESSKVFAYQPGKSLQIIQTFILNPAKTGLRQRFGYFGTDNGFFLERSDDVYFVSRSKVTGSVVDTKVAQADWNVDKLDGTGPSLITLNLDDPQILFTDVEWLGVGSVRMGFVINGQLIHCHTFHHANDDASPKGAYMQTACLPVRAEIENTGNTASNSTLKIVCSTVISEGGYELRGRERTAYTPITSQYSLATAGTYYPVASIRLNVSNGYLDAITSLRDVDLTGVTNGFYHYKIVSGGTVTGGTWSQTDAQSVVQYNINATSFTANGSIELTSGYISSSTQASTTLNLGSDAFKYQLERNSFANTATPITILVSASVNTSNVYAAITWQETT